MKQVEVLSWATLDALHHAATKVYETIGDLDIEEQMAVFCAIEDDYVALYYSEVDANFFRHFDDEEELFKYIQTRKNEIGEDDYETLDYDEDDENSDDNEDEEEDSDYSDKEDNY